MRTVRWAYLGGIIAAAIRLSVACGGDETGDGPNGGGPNGDAAIDPSSDSATDAVPSPLPSFCDGIVLYASFDAAVKADLGGGETLAVGDVAATAKGHFGGGLDLISDAAVSDSGAALYYVRPAGGAPVFPADEGSLAMWVRGDLRNGAPVYYRPLASVPPAPLVAAGLSLVSTNGRFGLLHTPADPAAAQYLHVFSLLEVEPFLRRNDFNQFVTAWRRGDAAGPTAYLAINGGLGERFDAPDASDPYLDASVSDAGSLDVPYRGFSSTKWDYDASVEALRLGAPNTTNAAQATVDDVVVWNRVLTFEEIADTYRVATSIREACRLP